MGRPHFEKERPPKKRMRRSIGHRRGRNRRRVLLCSYSACLPLFVILIANSLLAGASLDSNLKKMTQIVDALKSRLGISNRVEVRILENNALAFSVQPSRIPGDFVLSVDAHFMTELSDEELEAALAHELGHVWIYTHHPFLHTESLANRIAMQAVVRESLKKLYVKLWRFQATTGNFDDVLGAEPPAALTAAGR
jgi:hypothetical protein